jgi:solute carrier family 25 thiamine pyrophosphate transporter 19
MQVMPQMGIVFYTHNLFQAVLPNSASPDLTAGFFAGLIGKALILPMDIIRKRYQMQGPDRNKFVVGVPRYNGGIIQTARQIVTHEGYLALYKGLIPSILKAGLSSAVTFFVVEHARSAFVHWNQARVVDVE